MASKRPREDAPDPFGFESIAAPEPTAKKARLSEEPKAIDIIMTTKKLCSHLKSPKKFLRACGLLLRLLKSQLTKDTSEHFVECLNAVVEDRERAIAEVNRPLILEMMERVSKSEAFECCLDKWIVPGLFRNLLYTDDSFEFAKAASELNTRIGAPEPTLQKDLIACLETMLSRYHLLWARSSIENTFKTAMKHRMLLEEANRQALDELSNRLRKRKADILFSQRREGGPRLLREGAHPLRNRR